MICKKCGLEHTVEECKPEGGHTDGLRYLICKMGKGGCGAHWEMTKTQEAILDQEAKYRAS